MSHEAELVVALPVRLPPRPGDERLTGPELETLAVFSRLKKKPGFEKLPGSSVLRRYEPGDVICQQGQPGATAFYIITSEDLFHLRQAQLKVVEEALEAKREDRPVGRAAGRFRAWTEMSLEAEQERLQDELAVFEERSQVSMKSGMGMPVVRAFIKVAKSEKNKSKGFSGLMRNWFLPKPAKRKKATIPNADLSVDLDGDTLQAEMYEGEVFGEMSCLNRSPRAATVICEEFCYVLEFSRNVLDQMRRDDTFRQMLDDQYRNRVLEGHVRQLPMFANLSDRLFARLKKSVQLVELDAGQVLFEQHEPSDSFYIIRSGWVKVVQDGWSHLAETEAGPKAAFWPGLCEGLTRPPEAEGFRRVVIGSLPPSVAAAAKEFLSAVEKEPRRAAAEKVRQALNEWISSGKLIDALKAAKVTKANDLRPMLGNESATIAFQTFPESLEDVTDHQSRQLHRLGLEMAFPGLVPRRLEQSEGQRVLRYLGRGEFLGEVGLVLNLPRTATCMALSQPDLGQARAGGKGLVGSRTELIKLGRAQFQELLDADKDFALSVHRETERRAPAAALPAEVVKHRRAEPGLGASAEIDELGIAQGQKLMLVDLERCTRCSSCVEACIETHDDGWNRLYFDGPRFGRFMVPMTCRQCRDPVCMIGCPVGAINKGDKAEIAITDWCIGCTQCADQCPYGAIQMNELVEPAEPAADLVPLFEVGTTFKKVTHRAVVCDLCSTLPASIGPACVRACPHDAAIRVDGRQFFAKLSITSSLPPTMAAAISQGGPA